MREGRVPGLLQRRVEALHTLLDGTNIVPFAKRKPAFAGMEEGDSVRMKDEAEEPLRINVSAVKSTNLSISFVVLMKFGRRLRRCVRYCADSVASKSFLKLSRLLSRDKVGCGGILA